MPELRIHDDRPEAPGLLLHLPALLNELLAARPELGVTSWTVVESWGSGAQVAKLEDSIDSDDSHVVLAELLPKLKPEDIFWDAEFVQGDVAVGIFDSTWLFLRGPRELLEEVAERFTRTEIVD